MEERMELAKALIDRYGPLKAHIQWARELGQDPQNTRNWISGQSNPNKTALDIIAEKTPEFRKFFP